MPVTLTWEQIALRILLASAASSLIGYNRDERGKRLGIRTTMLVCRAATLAMLQANLLMNTTGRHRVLNASLCLFPFLARMKFLLEPIANHPTSILRHGELTSHDRRRSPQQRIHS